MFYEAWTESLRLSINPFCLKWRGRRDWRSVWLWKQPFILLNGALLQPWGVFLRVPCQGNSILATVETIPCRLPFSSHMAHLCFCLTHKCTSQERHEWLRSPCLRKPGVFYPTHQDVTLVKTCCGLQDGFSAQKGLSDKVKQRCASSQNNTKDFSYFLCWFEGGNLWKLL